MNIEIHRFQINDTCCDCRLYVASQYVCDCAENARYRVPPGTYDVDLRFSREARRKVPTLIPRNGCMQVMRGCFPIVKSGNGVHTLLEGQIIVGSHLVPGVVIHSFDTFLSLYDRINNAIRRGQEVTLTIVEYG